MTIDVASDGREVTHHVKLTKGADSVGLIAVTGAGNGQYQPDVRGMSKDPIQQLTFRTSAGTGTRRSSFEYPYSYDEQNTWEGGRGILYAPPTPVAFYDSRNAWSVNSEQVVPGGQVSYASGYRSQDFVLPGNMKWTALTTNPYIARSFVASATYSMTNGYIWLRRVGTPPNGVTIEVCANNAGDPGTVHASKTLSVSSITTDWISVMPTFVLTSPYGCTASTTYHFKVYSTGGDSTNHWLVGTDASSATNTKVSADGSSWSAGTSALYFRITDADVDRMWRFFRYKEGLYVVDQPANSGSAPKVFLNGWRGVADDNTADKTKLNDSTQTGWNATNIVGGIAKVFKGAGSADSPNYRTITAGASGVATCDSAWLTTHSATTTEYVILGTNHWTEWTGHGMTTPVTSVTAPEDVVYFALGNGTPIRRWGAYNNAGTWTSRTAANEAKNADLLAITVDNVDGVQVVRGLNSDEAGHVSISRASTKDWGNDLQFGSAIPIGHDTSKIINIQDGEEHLFIFKEDAVYAVQQDSPDKVVDLGNYRSEYTGLGCVFQTPYVYFSMARGGFERLMDNNMEDIGVWRGDGWPSDEQGPISAAEGHPQFILAAVDAGSSGYSSVRVFNGGWHTVYRHPIVGQRIRSLHIETTPGSAIDRLWIGAGADLIWIPLPGVLNPFYDPDFSFTHEYVITSSWIDNNALDLLKNIYKMRVFNEGGGSTCYAEWDYQSDDDNDSSAWNRGTGTFDTAPYEELTVNEECRRFRYRLRVYTEDSSEAFRLQSVVIALLDNIPPKYRSTIQFQIQIEDGESVDLTGDPDGQTFAGIMGKLYAWASSPTPVTMNSVDPDTDDTAVLVMAVPRRPQYLIEGEAGAYVATVILQEA